MLFTRERSRPSGFVAAAVVWALSGCAGHYLPLASAEKSHVEQLRDHVYRVEYEAGPFTSQERLDAYLRRRCAELAVREGYDYFRLSGRSDVLTLRRRTSMIVTMYKGSMPLGVSELIDAKGLLEASSPRGPDGE